MQITGKTAIVLMFADPVDHIRGTALINDQFAALSLDAVIAPIHVHPGDLAQCLDAVRLMHNVRGLGITIPHKIAAVPLMDELSHSARRLGAVNFIRRNPDGTLTGTNTDGIGFVSGLAANGVELDGKRALVVGVGGVGRAIALALVDKGLQELVLANRDAAKAEALAREIAELAPACRVRVVEAHGPDALDGIDLLVNATSLGMRQGDPLPLSLDRLGRETVVAEVIVNPTMTPLLEAATARGCKIVGGAEMLKPQPRLVAEFFGLIQ